MVKNPHLFSKATKKSLSHYYKNQHIIDKMTYGACYIEQLMIHLNLMEISEEYYNATKEKNIFLSHDRTVILNDGFYNDTEKINYPTILSLPKLNNNSKIYFKKKHRIDKAESHKIKIFDDSSLIDFFDFNYFGYFHLTYHKHFKLFQILCMGHLANNFGEKWLHRIHNYYLNKNKPITDAEKKYEELTGFRFEKKKRII